MDEERKELITGFHCCCNIQVQFTLRYKLNPSFFTSTGIILVHDLTNRKSHTNLRKWLGEVLNRDGYNDRKPSTW